MVIAPEKHGHHAWTCVGTDHGTDGAEEIFHSTHFHIHGNDLHFGQSGQKLLVQIGSCIRNDLICHK